MWCDVGVVVVCGCGACVVWRACLFFASLGLLAMKAVNLVCDVV